MLPAWLVQRVPRDHRERDHVSRRRRRVVAGTAVAGAGLLGLSLSTEPGSTEVYGLTLGVAARWSAGGRGAVARNPGPPGGGGTGPVLTPILLGAGAFGLFYGCALVSRRIPVLNGAIATILQYSDKGAQSLVLCTVVAPQARHRAGPADRLPCPCSRAPATPLAPPGRSAMSAPRWSRTQIQVPAEGIC